VQELTLYLIFVNLVAGMFMAYDKWAAPQGKWRVPEKTLFGIALAGATPTVFFLMRYLRHKSNKASFRWRMNMVLAAQLLVLALLSFIL
jgi:uncharacterized membrane protein YsdA (DUF1294 family)